MKIETQKYDNITVIELIGEFTAEFSNQLYERIDVVCDDNTTGIVIDLSNVGFIDSTGLEQLLETREYCRKNDHQIKLAGLDELCLKIMEITRLLPKFDIYDELSEAVKSFV